MTTPTTRKPPRFCCRAFAFRASNTDGDGGDGRTLEGYAAVFGQPTEISSWEGDFQEEIARGAFAKTLSERTPVMQFDHGRDRRTGSVPIASIDELSEDSHGLFVKARLFDNEAVAPIRDAIAGGAIDGMSFRFRVVDDIWRDKDGKVIKASELEELLWHPGDRHPLRRTIREAELFELGPVVFPAYDGTSVGVRSLLAALGSDGERRQLLAEMAEVVAAATDGEPDEHRQGDHGDQSDTEDVDGDADELDPPGAADSTPDPTPEPPRRHSGHQLGEAAASWHLPSPQLGTGGV